MQIVQVTERGKAVIYNFMQQNKHTSNTLLRCKASLRTLNWRFIISAHEIALLTA